jgi:mono/diheme cytochrome c family protein
MTSRSTPTTRTLAGLIAGALGIVLWFLATASGGGDTAAAVDTTTTTAAVTTTTAGPTTTTTGDPATTTSAGATTTTVDTTTTTGSSDAALVAEGEQIFLKTAGGVGCQYCHGVDGKGLPEAAAPDIRGKDYLAVTDALITRAQMSFISLTDHEIRAVVAYLATLP